MSLKSGNSSIEETVDNRTRVRALFASAIGSAIEWYDFFLYGTMAALVFQKLFFRTRILILV